MGPSGHNFGASTAISQVLRQTIAVPTTAAAAQVAPPTTAATTPKAATRTWYYGIDSVKWPIFATSAKRSQWRKRRTEIMGNKNSLGQFRELKKLKNAWAADRAALSFLSAFNEGVSTAYGAGQEDYTGSLAQGKEGLALTIAQHDVMTPPDVVLATRYLIPYGAAVRWWSKPESWAYIKKTAKGGLGADAYVEYYLSARAAVAAGIWPTGQYMLKDGRATPRPTIDTNFQMVRTAQLQGVMMDHATPAKALVFWRDMSKKTNAWRARLGLPPEILVLGDKSVAKIWQAPAAAGGFSTHTIPGAFALQSAGGAQHKMAQQPTTTKHQQQSTKAAPAAGLFAAAALAALFLL